MTGEMVVCQLWRHDNPRHFPPALTPVESSRCLFNDCSHTFSCFLALSAHRQQTPGPLLFNPSWARCKAHVSCCLLRPEIALG
jgi:hypothetical protein